METAQLEIDFDRRQELLDRAREAIDTLKYADLCYTRVHLTFDRIVIESHDMASIIHNIKALRPHTGTFELACIWNGRPGSGLAAWECASAPIELRLRFDPANPPDELVGPDERCGFREVEAKKLVWVCDM